MEQKLIEKIIEEAIKNNIDVTIFDDCEVNCYEDNYGKR